MIEAVENGNKIMLLYPSDISITITEYVNSMIATFIPSSTPSSVILPSTSVLITVAGLPPPPPPPPPSPLSFILITLDGSWRSVQHTLFKKSFLKKVSSLH